MESSRMAVDQDMLRSLPFGVMKVDIKGRIKCGNPIVSSFFRIPLNEVLTQPIQRFLPSTHIIKVMKTNQMNVMLTETEWGDKALLLELPLQLEDGVMEGLILLIGQEMFERMISHSDHVADLKQELEAIMNLIGELVTITDGKGQVLRVNAACEKVMGVKEWDFVGQPASVLEDRMIVDQSSTKKVLKEQRPVTVVQTTKSGRRLIVNGYPIYNETGNLVKVINISKDITEEDKLSKQLEESKRLVRQYEEELSRVRQEGKEQIVVKSKAMEEIYDLAYRIADVDSTVLILGESGVGKEVLARNIHQHSSRHKEPFMKINCGAIPENLMESELFGYVKGTFTGGNKDGKTGMIVSAHKGTFFLDEIGELPLHLQVKLLQVLQEKRVTPLGSTASIEVDVRFIAATNRNLENMVKNGQFREDLFYRLNVIPMTIPSLRERKEDIPFLIDHFLLLYNSKYGKSVVMDQGAMEICVHYPWNGNVRELQNVVERLVVTSPQEFITDRDMPNNMKQLQPWSREKASVSLKEAVEDYEKGLLLDMLKQCRTMREAGQKLGVDISTISRKIKKYKIEFADMQ
ncbi:sigma-54-dependent Fis family transcriptional regulator [Ammoniphilus sp. YIM 78166]|uniref:sigma-54 interaction domain-containing protein n=1 Tax=Ammoniphilus sp. YIM 78166 TaxID=1644106 RepID=UPI00106F65FD|nr:sigma 54-interacting transcriptional regulator [Ammoniphilus sp. YIM 78166]